MATEKKSFPVSSRHPRFSPAGTSLTPALPFLFLGVALLAACASDPKPHPRPVAVPREFSGDTLEKGQRAPDSMGWWKDFRDPALDSLVSLTLGENFDLRGAWARFRQSVAAAQEAGAARFPRIEATADASRSRRFLNLGIPQAPSTITTERYGISLAARYEVDLWGRLADLDEAAEIEAAASRYDVAALAMSLSARVAEVWYGLVTQRGQRRLLRDQLAADSTYLELVRLRFGAGLVSAVDVRRQRQELLATAAEIPRVEARIATLRHQLSVLTGRPPGRGTWRGDTKELVVPDPPRTALPLTVLERRPDVQAAWLRLRAADHRVAAAVKDRLPALRLNGSLGFDSSDLSTLFAEWVYSIGTSIVAPLFDGGRRQAAVERQRAAVDAAVANLGVTLLTSLREVEDALVRGARQREHVERVAERLEVAERLLEETRRRYRQGLTDYLPVLDAIQTLHRLQRSLLSARHQIVVHRIQLYRALGGRWLDELEPGRASPASDSGLLPAPAEGSDD